MKETEKKTQKKVEGIMKKEERLQNMSWIYTKSYVKKKKIRKQDMPEIYIITCLKKKNKK